MHYKSFERDHHASQLLVQKIKQQPNYNTNNLNDTHTQTNNK